jgi:hypothetical protein
MWLVSQKAKLANLRNFVRRPTLMLDMNVGGERKS